MFASLISGLTSASLTVLSSVMTKKMFELLIRKILIAVLKKIVASTENTVDDDLIKPLIVELEK